MAEISNKTLALLVLAALAVVVVATGIQLNQLGNLGLTGKATQDYGDVILTLAGAVNIQVNSSNDTINFGTCTADDNYQWISSANATSNTTVCNGPAADRLDWIQVDNIGSVDANVTMEGECTVAAWLPEAGGTANSFQVMTNHTGCAWGNTSWVALTASAITACENLTVQGSLRFWARVKLDSDAGGPQNCGGDATNTIWFNATQAGI